MSLDPAPSPLKWEPAALSFSVALNKPSPQQLRTRNTSANNVAYTFKVKTTNPKRYSVRPNVGIAWPGEDVTVTVQLPPMKEYPSDMNKCKDKFQVLTLALAPELAAKLKLKDSDQQRVELTELWASDDAKSAAVDKIRCSMVFDSSFRGVPIAEEEHPIPPYSPETVSAAHDGPVATPTPAQTPNVERAQPTPHPEAASPPARTVGASEPAAADGRGGDSDMQMRLAAAERSVALLTREKSDAAAATSKLKAELDATNQQLRSSGNNGSKGVFGVRVLLLCVLAAFGAGLAVGQQQLLMTPVPATPTLKPTPVKRGSKRDEL